MANSCIFKIELYILYPIADNVNVKKNCNKYNYKKPGVFTYVGRFKRFIDEQIKGWPVKVTNVRNRPKSTAASPFPVSFITLSIICLIYVIK